MKKKLLFILNTYDFQSKYLKKNLSLKKNYKFFNTQDKSWANYFFNNLNKDFKLFKDYPNLNKSFLQKDSYTFLKEKIDNFNPDLIFSTMNDPKIDKILKNLNHPKKLIWVSHKVDDKRIKKLKDSYDYIISSNKTVLSIAKKIKFNKFEMLISTPTFLKLTKKNFYKRKNNIIFTGSLGSNFLNRLNILSYVSDNFKIKLRLRNLVEKYYLLNSFTYFLNKFFPIFTYFLFKKKVLPMTNKLKHFNDDELFGLKMLNEFTKYKFCLNIHSDFDENKNINARVFEALSSGCLLFTDKNLYMEKIFKDKKHLIYFKTKKDLEKKIKFYKSNEKLSFRIAQRGNNYLFSNHSSEVRIKQFKKILKKILKHNS